MSDFAPIALFVYRRLEHARETIEALKLNQHAMLSDLYVFSDGPKDPTSISDVDQVRDYVRSVQGFNTIRIVERNENLGLANSIIRGVSEVLQRHERVIVVEDDLVTSPFFLRFMNDALDLYNSDLRVASIHGYVYPTMDTLPETFFLRGADCWGWATWRRGWQLFNPDGRTLLQALESQKLTTEFDFGGSFQYTQMLRDQIDGKNDSWAIRWYASAFLANALTLYPGRSLVHNIGNDGSGTHCVQSSAYGASMSTEPINVESIMVEDSALARHSFAAYARRGISPAKTPNVFARMMHRLARTSSRNQ